ncbi:MAG: PhnD/SsuA/transferrin family substrate-binding protein [Campylobacterales bacterium]
MPKTILLLIFVWLMSLNAQEIRFAPLPKEKVETLEKEYKPFLKWLSRQTGDTYTLVVSVDYNDLADKIKKGEVDIAYLGPLPYAIVKQHTDSIVPILKFLDKNGNSAYTCSIIARKDSGIKSVKELKNKKISLTQKYSTCGYYNAKIAFDKEKTNLSGYSFDGTHSNVALNVITGESDGGSLQTAYFDKYQYLGLTKIYESEPLPGFLLAANKNRLNEEKIAKIKKLIIKLSPLSNAKDKEITSSWSEGIRYGAVEAKEQEYAQIVKNFKEMAALK